MATLGRQPPSKINSQPRLLCQEKKTLPLPGYPRTVDEMDIAHHQQAITKPGVLTAVIND